MSQWHPPTNTNAAATNWRAHYERWRDIHAPASAVNDRLRKKILAASHSNWLSGGQRDELLGVVTQIDDDQIDDEQRGR